MRISLFDGVENTVVKGENAGYQNFFPFPTVFSKAFFSKVRIVWYRAKKDKMLVTSILSFFHYTGV